MTRRYSLEALVSAAGLSELDLARRVGMDRTQLRRAREHGLVETAADRYAVGVGLEPWLVWGDWLEDAKVKCADDRCGRWFVPSRKGHRFCVEACRKRAYDRADKARRRQDPVFREREQERVAAYRSTASAKRVARVKRRAYYVANREKELARQREYDRRRRMSSGPQDERGTVAA